jgi:asparagine synthase (glutamine-hydrolysing)
MCGITGYIQQGSPNLEPIIQEMAAALVHRGPDDAGTWCDGSAGVAFGFRRLSILDLSPEGRQPMRSGSGRYVIVFNGEVYNFPELKRELSGKGHRFSGGSDTEVILAAFETWGIAGSLPRFNGMFAMAVWDGEERRLSLARDRLGKKPLYYGWCGGCFFFGSELKALRRHPTFRPGIDHNALGQYMRRGYIPYPMSIFRGIHKLIPGSLLQLSEQELATPPAGFTPYLAGAGEHGPEPFWDLLAVAARSQADPFRGDEREALDELDRLLRDATLRRMRSDVPLGAFLSGGIDSSLVVALMQAEHHSPVKTFTIGFRESDYDEAPHARRIAGHLGTDHTELYLSADEGLDVIPDLPWIYDEPLSDASQIPTFLVSRLARRQVTVALCGDGGDEIFVGYNRYIWPERILSRLRFCPLGLRQAIGRTGLALPPAVRNRIGQGLAACLPASIRPQRPGESLEKLFRTISAGDADELYCDLTTYWPGQTVPAAELQGPQFTMDHLRMLPDFLSRSMFLDLGTYLPEDLLAKVDRASMAASIEVRAPLLDYRVVELAASIPSALRAKNGEKKYLLRALLERYLPRELYERPKMGFSVPIGRWLNGPLRSWAEDLLDESLLRREGFFDPAIIRSRWQEQRSGARNWQNELWTVLVFQAWHHAQGGSR